MNRKLALICLVCAITFTNALELENLCEKSIFQYKDVKVNAIHRIKYSTKLPKVSTLK